MKKQLFLLLLLSGLGVSCISAGSASEKIQDTLKQAEEKSEQAQHDLKEKLTGKTEEPEEKANDLSGDLSTAFGELKSFGSKKAIPQFVATRMKEEPYAVAGLIATAPFLATKYGKVAGAILGLSGLIGFSLDYFFNKDEAPKKA